MTKPLHLSIFLHLLLAIFIALLFLTTKKSSTKINIPLDVIISPIQEATRLNLEKIPEKMTEIPKPEKSVFGIHKKSATSSNSESAISVKAGNTLAKEQDNLTLNPDDPDSLPIPTDEYLIQQMPRLISDIKIPYPPMAKQQKIQGPVVMDILIDANGKVRSVEILSAPSIDLSDAAKAAIKEFKFIPARLEDQNVAVKIRYTYRFVLED